MATPYLWNPIFHYTFDKAGQGLMLIRVFMDNTCHTKPVVGLFTACLLDSFMGETYE